MSYLCHHLSDNVALSDLYVILTELYVDFSDLYVVSSLIHLLENKILSSLCHTDNLTSRYNIIIRDLASQHNYQTRRIKVSFSTSQINMWACQKMMPTVR